MNNGVWVSFERYEAMAAAETAMSNAEYVLRLEKTKHKEEVARLNKRIEFLENAFRDCEYMKCSGLEASEGGSDRD